MVQLTRKVEPFFSYHKNCLEYFSKYSSIKVNEVTFIIFWQNFAISALEKNSFVNPKSSFQISAFEKYNFYYFSIRYSRAFQRLDKLNLVILVWFQAQTTFHYCLSFSFSLKTICKVLVIQIYQKRSKKRTNIIIFNSSRLSIERLLHSSPQKMQQTFVLHSKYCPKYPIAFCCSTFEKAVFIRWPRPPTCRGPNSIVCLCKMAF